MPNCQIKISYVTDFDSEKWALIFKALLFNAIMVSVLLLIMNFFGKFNDISQFNVAGSLTGIYFNKLSFPNFWVFFSGMCIMIPSAEEMLYRLPVFLLIANNFECSIGNRNIAKYILWLSLIIPTGFWAAGHEPFPLPVFISGLTYGWLIIKTKPLWPWPAIVCHSLSNLSIYILVKILQVLGHAPIN